MSSLRFVFIGLAVLMGNAQGQCQAPSAAKNVLLICVDDLRPELNCYGQNYIVSPNIDALAQEGVLFQRHYVQAPTCGASRYALLTGCYGGASNGAIFERANRIASGQDVLPSMPAWFRQHGYRTVSVGKVSHHPGGRGGSDWNDGDQPEMPLSWDEHLCSTGSWQHPRGAMHGLAHGEIRGQASKMDVLQAAEGGDGIYPDGLTLQTALKKLGELSQGDKPFFLAVGFLKPHLPFGAPKKYLDLYEGVDLPAISHPGKPSGKTTWHRSGEFMKYNRWGRDPNSDEEFATLVRKHYAACVSYSDALVGQLLAALDTAGCKDNTVVVLWGDHGWHLGEHAIWGKHALFEESLHSPLIIRPAADNAMVAQTVDTVVETIDIFPTVCKLAGVESLDGIDGNDLLASSVDGLENEGAKAFAISYTGKAKTIRTDRYRMIDHRDGSIELYDHSAAGETKNTASESTEVVERLRGILNQRLKRR